MPPFNEACVLSFPYQYVLDLGLLNSFLDALSHDLDIAQITAADPIMSMHAA